MMLGSHNIGDEALEAKSSCCIGLGTSITPKLDMNVLQFTRSLVETRKIIKAVGRLIPSSFRPVANTLDTLDKASKPATSPSKLSRSAH